MADLKPRILSTVVLLVLLNADAFGQQQISVSNISPTGSVAAQSTSAIAPSESVGSSNITVSSESQNHSSRQQLISVSSSSYQHNIHMPLTDVLYSSSSAFLSSLSSVTAYFSKNISIFSDTEPVLSSSVMTDSPSSVENSSSTLYIAVTKTLETSDVSSIVVQQPKDELSSSFSSVTRADSSIRIYPTRTSAAVALPDLTSSAVHLSASEADSAVATVSTVEYTPLTETSNSVTASSVITSQFSSPYIISETPLNLTVSSSLKNNAGNATTITMFSSTSKPVVSPTLHDITRVTEDTLYDSNILTRKSSDLLDTPVIPVSTSTRNITSTRIYSAIDASSLFLSGDFFSQAITSDSSIGTNFSHSIFTSYKPSEKIDGTSFSYSPLSTSTSTSSTRMSMASFSNVVETSTSSAVLNTTNVPTLNSTLNASYTPTENQTQYIVAKFSIQFHGNCDRIQENNQIENTFWTALVESLSTDSPVELSNDSLELDHFLYNPFRVIMSIRHPKTDLFISKLNESICDKDLIVSIFDGRKNVKYTGEALKLLSDTGDEVDIAIAKTGLEMVDIIIIIVASFLFGVLAVFGVIFLCRECYMKKRAASFNLLDIPHVNLKLSDFTLTKIPRPQMIYHENNEARSASADSNGRPKPPKRRAPCVNSDQIRVDPDKIHVRMSDHRDGIVVGVTCSSCQIPAKRNSLASSDSACADPPRQTLLKGGNSTDSTGGVTNPSYSSADESGRNSKIMIEDDDNEQLL